MTDIRRRVLTALTLERTPGFNYSGNFLGVRFTDSSPQRSVLVIDQGLHCEDEAGHTDIGAVCLLADVSMGTVVRANLSPEQRLATVSLTLQFTGAPFTGPLEGTGTFENFVDGTDSRQGLCRVAVTAGGRQVLYGTGAFMVMNPPPGRTMYPLVSADHSKADPLAEHALEPHEAELLSRADRALDSTQGERNFLRHFWGFLPETTGDGARCQIDNGPHLGNRVGHMQGGLQLGMAIITAEAALPTGWRVAGISAFFLGAGEGSGITARSCIEHRGRNTAVVRTTLTTQSGRRVLDAVTTHLRRE